MFYGANPKIFKYAYELRNNMTEAEAKLWNALKKNQLGVRFKAQHPIDTFIADFYCHKARLVIEIDGDIHKLQLEYDIARTDTLSEFGIKVIRFKNADVLCKCDEVVEEIKRELKNRIS